MYRYVFANGKLQADPTWGPVSYLKSVVAVSQADASKVANLEPFASMGSKNSFIPSMVSVDPASDLIFVMDAGTGKIGGVALDNGKLTTKWTQIRPRSASPP